MAIKREEMNIKSSASNLSQISDSLCFDKWLSDVVITYIERFAKLIIVRQGLWLSTQGIRVTRLGLKSPGFFLVCLRYE